MRGELDAARRRRTIEEFLSCSVLFCSVLADADACAVRPVEQDEPVVVDRAGIGRPDQTPEHGRQLYGSLGFHASHTAIRTSKGVNYHRHKAGGLRLSRDGMSHRRLIDGSLPASRVSAEAGDQQVVAATSACPENPHALHLNLDFALLVFAACLH